MSTRSQGPYRHPEMEGFQQLLLEHFDEALPVGYDMDGKELPALTVIKSALMHKLNEIETLKHAAIHEGGSDAPAGFEVEEAIRAGVLSEHIFSGVSVVSAVGIIGVLLDQKNNKKKELIQALTIWLEFEENSNSENKTIKSQAYDTLAQRLHESGLEYEAIPEIDTRYFKPTFFHDLAKELGIGTKKKSFSERLSKTGYRLTHITKEQARELGKNLKAKSLSGLKCGWNIIAGALPNPNGAQEFVTTIGKGAVTFVRAPFEFRTLSNELRDGVLQLEEEDPELAEALHAPMTQEVLRKIEIDPARLKEMKRVHKNIPKHIWEAKKLYATFLAQGIFIAFQTAQFAQNYANDNIGDMIINICSISAASSPFKVLALEAMEERDIALSMRAKIGELDYRTIGIEDNGNVDQPSTTPP